MLEPNYDRHAHLYSPPTNPPENEILAGGGDCSWRFNNRPFSYLPSRLRNRGSQRDTPRSYLFRSLRGSLQRHAFKSRIASQQSVGREPYANSSLEQQSLRRETYSRDGENRAIRFASFPSRDSVECSVHPYRQRYLCCLKIFLVDSRLLI